MKHLKLLVCFNSNVDFHFRRIFLQEQIKSLDDSQTQNSSAMSYWSPHWWIEYRVSLKSGNNKFSQSVGLNILVFISQKFLFFVDWRIVGASSLRNTTSKRFMQHENKMKTIFTYLTENMSRSVSVLMKEENRKERKHWSLSSTPA